MTVTEYAKKYNKSRPRIYLLLKAGRIPGAELNKAGQWNIPETTEIYELRPTGRRVKTNIHYQLIKSATLSDIGEPLHQPTGASTPLVDK